MIHQPIFSIMIGISSFKNHQEESNKLTKFCLNLEKTKRKDVVTSWISKNTFNTLNSVDISKLENFKNINNFVYKEVDAFRKTINYPKPLKVSGGWINVYKKYDFQEYHHHSQHHLSAIYFLNSHETCAKLFFKSPISNYPNIPNPNQHMPFTWQDVRFKPVQGNLIIFPSYLNHCVEQQENNKTRISLAYNFDA
jgi:uncharacterized protein (TIGR02466 family)